MPLISASSPTQPAPSRGWYWAGLLLALLPVALYLRVLANMSTWVPGTDDFASILNFVGAWQTHPGWGERWELFTGQFVAHRLLFARALLVIDYSLTGHADIGALQIVGWIGWLLVVGGLATSFPAVRRQPWLALPATLLLMHPQGYSNLLSAVGAGNTWIIAFVFFAVWAAHAASPRLFVVALGLGLLAPTAFANGLMVFPAACAGLVMQKRWARAAWFAGAGALAFWLYLHNYDSGLGASFSLLEIFRKAAIMTGGLVIIGRTPDAPSLYAGFAILLVAASFLLRPRVWREHPVAASFLSFLVLTVFMAARGRVGIMADYYMLQDRYRIYGLLMLATMYLLVIEPLTALARRRLGLLAAALAAVYCLLSYATYYHQLVVLRNWLQATAMNAQFGGCFPCAIPKDWPMSCESMERAAEQGIYRLPEFLSPADTALIHSLSRATPAADELFALEKNISVSGYYVSPKDLTASPVQPAATDFAVLVSEGHTLILPVAPFRVRFAELAPRLSFLSDRYGFILPEPLYRPGRHALYGLKRNADGQLIVAFSSSLTCP